MGVAGSKSPLERRNTVLRRSQRKSIHGVKSKADKLIKDIRKFKGTEENTDYIELKARIESAERELKIHAKTLQPQIRQIYNETLKKIQECHKLLDDKLKENQQKLLEKQEKLAAAQKVEEKDDDDDVFVEEVNDEERQLEESTDKRKTVELKLIQVEPIETSPQINKRFSAMKIGVPVLPGTMLESLNRRTEDMNLKYERRIAEIRSEIEQLEIEISQFVGRRNGNYYNKIRRQLDGYSHELKGVTSSDDAIQEQTKLCSQYIDSCLSFLDEKAVDGDVDEDFEDDDDEIMTKRTEEVTSGADSNLSPRSIRTTYI